METTQAVELPEQRHCQIDGVDVAHLVVLVVQSYIAEKAQSLGSKAERECMKSRRIVEFERIIVIENASCFVKDLLVDSKNTQR